MIRQFLFLLACMVAISCGEPTKNEPKVQELNSMADSTVAPIDEAFKNVAFDSKRDFICGMPITAGVSDTAHFKDKVYGFCSKECKDEFMKNPSSYVAAAAVK